MLLRGASAAVVLYGVLQVGRDAANGLYGLIQGNFYGPFMEILGSSVAFIIPGVLLGLTSNRIARWIVPAGLRTDGCPHCGYSLKNLKSPICPECGNDIGPARDRAPRPR